MLRSYLPSALGIPYTRQGPPCHAKRGRIWCQSWQRHAIVARLYAEVLLHCFQISFPFVLEFVTVTKCLSKATSDRKDLFGMALLAHGKGAVLGQSVSHHGGQEAESQRIPEPVNFLLFPLIHQGF